MFNFMFNKHVTTIQSNSIILFQECFEIPASWKVLMSIKTTSSYEFNFRAEKIRNYGAQIFICLVETFDATGAP